ncbi:hypothetical protein B7463_g10842, partial [Scytalidium lignicola]
MCASVIKSLLFALAITAPVSAFNVRYVGYWDDNCQEEETGGQFSDEYNCYDFDIWQVSSYKLYNTGDACPTGQSLEATFYGTEGNGIICGTDPLVVIPVGESTDCVKGFDAASAVAEVTCS